MFNKNKAQIAYERGRQTIANALKTRLICHQDTYGKELDVATVMNMIDTVMASVKDLS